VLSLVRWGGEDHSASVIREPGLQTWLGWWHLQAGLVRSVSSVTVRCRPLLNALIAGLLASPGLSPPLQGPAGARQSGGGDAGEHRLGPG